MADIVATAAQVAAIDPIKAKIFDYIALVAITAGQSVYLDPTTGKVGLCDANDSGKEQFRGIALNTVGAGQAVGVLKEGRIAGFTLAGSYDDIIYQGDTAGVLSTTVSGTKTIRVGRILSLSDSNLTKVLYVFADYLNNW